MQVRTNLPTIPERFRSADMMMDGMRNGGFFLQKRQDEPGVYSYRFRQSPPRRLGELKRRPDQKILKFRATRLTHALPVRHLESKQRLGNEYDEKIAQWMTLFCVSWHDILFNTVLGFVELGTEWLDKIRSAKWRLKYWRMNWNLHLDVRLRGHNESSGLDSDNTTDPLAVVLPLYDTPWLAQNPGRDGW